MGLHWEFSTEQTLIAASANMVISFDMTRGRLAESASYLNPVVVGFQVGSLASHALACHPSTLASPRSPSMLDLDH